MNEIIRVAYADNRFYRALDSVDFKNLLVELNIWKSLKLVSLHRKWRSDRHTVIHLDWKLYTDASTSGSGANLYKPTGEKWYDDRFFGFTRHLDREPIHVKEMHAIHRAVISYQETLKDQHVTVLCDNQAVVWAFRKMGGRDLRLSRYLREITQFCYDKNIELHVDWVSTVHQKADEISRALPTNECSLRKGFENV